MNSVSLAQVSESKSVCSGMCMAPQPFWPTHPMSDSDVAGDPVKPRVRPLCRKRCEIAPGPLQGAQWIFVVIASPRFGLWRKEYKRERADLCSDFAGEVVLGIVFASNCLVKTSTPPRRFVLQTSEMSPVKGFVEYQILSVAPLQVPFEVEEELSASAFADCVVSLSSGRMWKRFVWQSVDTDDAINAWVARGA